MNNAVMNANVQVSVQVLSFYSFGYITRSGIAESNDNSMFSFFGEPSYRKRDTLKEEQHPSKYIILLTQKWC